MAILVGSRSTVSQQRYWFTPNGSKRWGGWQMASSLVGGQYAYGGLTDQQNNYIGGAVTSALERTSRRKHQAAFNFTQVKLEFSNGVCDTKPTTASEHGSITVGASLETAGGTIVPVTFDGGSSTKVMSVDTTAVSDAVNFSVSEGEVFWVRTYVRSEIGYRYPQNMLTDQNAGEGTVTGNSTLSGTIAASNQRAYTATAVLAQRSVPTPNVLFIGDSITVGRSEASDQTYPDRSRGWVGRIMSGTLPHYRMAVGGDRAWYIPSDWALRHDIPDSGGFSHAVVAFGVNDLQDTPFQTDTELLSSLSTLLQWLADAGIPKIYATTVTPFSVTGPYTSAGAQGYNATFETRRQAVNAAIRNLWDSNLDGYIDTAIALEDPVNPAVWRSDGGVAYTNDGTHPNSLGHDTIAASINAQKLFAV